MRIVFALLLSILTVGAAAAQTTRYVATTGSNSGNDCSVQAAPCLTIQWAIDGAADGDAIEVAAGAYSESIVVDKALHLKGAQRNVSRVSRVIFGPSESTIDASGLPVGVQLAHSDAIIEGFSVQGDASTWTGILINPTAATGNFSGIRIAGNMIGGMLAKNPNSTAYNYSHGIFAVGENVAGTRRRVTGLTIDDNLIQNIGGLVYDAANMSSGAAIFLYSAQGASAGAGATITGNDIVGLTPGEKNDVLNPSVGITVSEDGNGNPSTGGLVSGNTYNSMSVGFVAFASATTVTETQASFTTVPALGINFGKLATVTEAALQPVIFSDATPGFAGSRVYFADAASAAAFGVPAAEIEGAVPLAGTGTPLLTIVGGNIVVTENGVVVFRTPVGSVSNLTIDGTTGDDTLELSFTGGNPIPEGGLTYNGGAGNDAIEISGGSATNVAHTFANANDGTITYDGKTITYTGLEPILDAVPAATRTFTFGGIDDTITLSDDGVAGDGYSMIASPASETVTFLAPTTSITVNAGTGADDIVVNALDALQGGTVVLNGEDGADTFSIAAGTVTFTVNGGDPAVAPGDVLSLSGVTPGAVLTNVGGNGSVTFTAAGTITFTGIETTPLPDLALGVAVVPVANFPASQPNVILSLTNGGSVGVSGVSVTVDPLPAGLTLLSNVADQGTYATGTGVWTVGNVPAGATINLTLNVEVASDVNQAPVEAEVTAQGSPDFDSTPGDGAGDDFVSTLVSVGELAALPSNALALAVTFDANGRTFAGSYGYGAFRSAGTGSWTAINTGLTNQFVWDIQAHTPTGNVIAGTLGGGLFRTTNQGATWTAINLGASYVRGVAQGPDFALYATGDLDISSATTGSARVWKSTDGGLTWTELAWITRTAVEPWRVAVDPNNAATIYMGTRKGLYKSTDGGATWAATGFFGKRADVYGLVVTTTGVVIVGTRDGIHRSMDGGATFSALINPAAPGRARNTYDIAYHPISNRLYFALWGRPGVIVSADGGATYFDVPLGTMPTGEEVASVAVRPDGHLLVAFTDGSTRVVNPGAATASETVDAPTRLSLAAPAPNPSRGTSQIRFGLAESGQVRLTVFDALGREVARLAAGEQAAGWHTATFDGQNLGAGVYVLRLEANGRALTRTLSLVR